MVVLIIPQWSFVHVGSSPTLTGASLQVRHRCRFPLPPQHQRAVFPWH
ncbi:MAG UNVERIFIED_CONTAM: hypothetical protein LVR18_40090 [Planctomycetaceae bacterium]